MSLVEILTLVLLAGILVLLVLIFNSIAAARRSLEEGDRARAAAAARPGATHEAAGATGGYGGGGAPAGAEGYAPGGYGGTAAPGASGGFGAATPGYEPQTGGYGAATGTPSRTTEQPSYAGTEQTSDYATWSEGTSAAGAQPSGAPALEEFPEETPFEREGRWWFKRGDELLVYDEQAGQWITPPPGTTPGGAGGGQPSSGDAGYRYDTGGGATEPAGAGVSTGEPGGWRCPSCGAINGASATTCRMCFSARP